MNNIFFFAVILYVCFLPTSSVMSSETAADTYDDQHGQKKKRRTKGDVQVTSLVKDEVNAALEAEAKRDRDENMVGAMKKAIGTYLDEDPQHKKKLRVTYTEAENACENIFWIKRYVELVVSEAEKNEIRFSKDLAALNKIFKLNGDQEEDLETQRSAFLTRYWYRFVSIQKARYNRDWRHVVLLCDHFQNRYKGVVDIDEIRAEAEQELDIQSLSPTRTTSLEPTPQTTPIFRSSFTEQTVVVHVQRDQPLSAQTLVGVEDGEWVEAMQQLDLQLLPTTGMTASEPTPQTMPILRLPSTERAVVVHVQRNQPPPAQTLVGIGGIAQSPTVSSSYSSSSSSCASDLDGTPRLKGKEGKFSSKDQQQPTVKPSAGAVKKLSAFESCLAMLCCWKASPTK